MSLEGLVISGSEPYTVIRRGELVYSTTTLRRTAPATVTAAVRLMVRFKAPEALTLRRELDGDDTQGAVLVWASNRLIALAADATTGVPLGWTALQIAPAEDADGPPGDLVEFRGRRYEITREHLWPSGFESTFLPAGFRRYEAFERGPSITP